MHAGIGRNFWLYRIGQAVSVRMIASAAREPQFLSY